MALSTMIPVVVYFPRQTQRRAWYAPIATFIRHGNGGVVVVGGGGGGGGVVRLSHSLPFLLPTG